VPGEHSNQHLTISSPAGSSVYPAGFGNLTEVSERILVEGRTGLRLASRPCVLSGQRGQTPLVLIDACGETLVRFLPGPMEMTRFLRRTVCLSTAIGGLHKIERNRPTFW
jgi:hypothetical protein